MPTESDTSFLDNIPGLEDASPDNTQTDNANSGDTNQPGGNQDNGANPQGSQADNTVTQNTAGGNAQQVNRQQQQQANRQPARGNTGDLVDPVTGNIVARGGVERRIYENAQRWERQARQNEQQISTLNAELRGLREGNQLASQLGVSPQEQVAAVRMLADFKRDPVGTLQAVIAEMQAKGHQLPFLQNAGGLNLQSIERMLDNRLAPLTNQQRQQQQQQEHEERARQELDGFLQTYPHAQNNLDVVGKIMQGEGLSLRDAYIRLIDWAQDNGFDYRQPLAPQVEARNQQSNGNSTGQQPRSTSRPLPGQRSATGGGGVNQPRVFDENASYTDIVRAAMAEAGLPVN